VEIRSNFNSSAEGLTSILGVTEASSLSSYGQLSRAGEGTGDSGLDGDWATLSFAGSKMAQAASDTGVREGKVAAIRSELAAGTYSVPTHVVAARTVGVMLNQGV